MIQLNRAIRTLLCAIAAALAGCSGLAHDLGKSGGQGATSGIVAGLKSPENQQGLADIAGSPAAQQASQAVGMGVGRGLVDEAVAIGTGQTQPMIAGHHAAALNSNATTQAAASLADRLPAYMHDNIDPALAELIRQSVEKAMQQALSPQSRADAGEMAQTVADHAMHGALTAFGRDAAPMLHRFIVDQLGPIIGEIMTQQIRPMLKDFFNNDIAPTVIRIMRESADNALKGSVKPDTSSDVVINASNVSKGAALGTHQAAIDLGLLTKEGSLTPAMHAFLWLVVTVVALVGLVAIGFLIVLTMIAFKLRRLIK